MDGLGVADDFCAETVVIEIRPAAIKDRKAKKRESMFIGKRGSQQAAVEQIGCNSDLFRESAFRRSHQEDAAKCRFCLSKVDPWPDTKNDSVPDAVNVEKE